MRTMPTIFAERLAATKQVKSESSDPFAILRIGRKSTALRSTQFLESQNILTATSLQDVAVSVCHPHENKANTGIYIGYVDNGTAHIKYATAKVAMKDHVWVDTGFEETASAIAIEFDGTMPKDIRGLIEFVTELEPWVFWINGGAVYGKIISDESPITLAETNATDVAAVRAMWSEVGGFDFGLVLFYILNGDIYYRQYIDEVWTDAAPINFGPAVNAWTAIAAMRTWDYRICLQAIDDTGVAYELFTNFEGIGKQSTDHLKVNNITATGAQTAVTYHETENDDERIEVSEISGLGDNLSLIPAVPLTCENIDDGNGNWGLKVVATFSHRLFSIGAGTGFYIQDSNNVIYGAAGATTNDGGFTVTFDMTDFNLAEGLECEFKYAPGTIYSEAVPLEACSITFYPTNLIAPMVDPPAFEEAWNE